VFSSATPLRLVFCVAVDNGKFDVNVARDFKSSFSTTVVIYSISGPRYHRLVPLRR